MRTLSLSVHAYYNVAENEKCRHAVSNQRSKTVNDPIYARIERIRPLDHHGRLVIIPFLGMPNIQMVNIL